MKTHLASFSLATVFLVLASGVPARAQDPFAATDPDGFLPPNNQALTKADVLAVITAAAMAVDNPTMVIAVTDRQGNPLGVFKKNGAPALVEGNFGRMSPPEEVAVALARTASFFSNTEAPLSSRTVRFISGVHFPPGIQFVPQAALYGIDNTNRGCGAVGADGQFHEFAANFIPGKEVPAARSIDRSTTGLGILTGKKDLVDSVPYPVEANNLRGAVNPGGIPLYKGGRMVGGVGVSGIPGVPGDNRNADGYFAGTIAEYAALIGAAAPGLFKFPAPDGVVIIDGISLPFVDKPLVLQSVLNGQQLPGTKAVPAGTPLESLGSFIQLPPPLDPKAALPKDTGGDGTAATPADATEGSPDAVATATLWDSPGPVPEGYLVAVRGGPLGGLTKDEVQRIFDQSLATAIQTRALIRLPVGVRAKFVIAVSDLDGQLIGLYRMKDATIFSIDVAVSKSRNVIYFSGMTRNPAEMEGVPMGTAVTNRTIEFGAEPLYPPGLDYTNPTLDPNKGGPFFPLYIKDTNNPCTQGDQPPSPYQSGIVFFPGSTPIYKNGVMVGGLGISGDGIDQDDFATIGGIAGFDAPLEKRADRVIVRGVRLPYSKFPRNPTK